MINDVDMLNYVLQNAEIGCSSITTVRKQLKDSRVDGLLVEHLIKYGKLYHCANTMLRKRGGEIRHINPMVRKMVRFSSQRELNRDSSPSHVAQMMIKGSTMGVSKMAKHIRDYDGKDPKVATLARKMMDTEEENIGELKVFL